MHIWVVESRETAGWFARYGAFLTRWEARIMCKRANEIHAGCYRVRKYVRA
jgi:hypothetical protein